MKEGGKRGKERERTHLGRVHLVQQAIDDVCEDGAGRLRKEGFQRLSRSPVDTNLLHK